MCNYNTLKNCRHGYVVQCRNCDHIQVAFGTTILSLTRAQYYEYLAQVQEQYDEHHKIMPWDQKAIHLPTAAKGVAMIYTVSELHILLDMLKEGRKKLEYNDLFVFNEN
ncbi:hypothetical protein GCM10023093_03710 [Nemorincola caseinilytica]|uniref:Uncharacterized protein n=1 Tax=Nemorincola caseinilytica TaxID=2054315 RepID=A0ABP8N7R5_9BACT